jgi:hypothetical protein
MSKRKEHGAIIVNKKYDNARKPGFQLSPLFG